MKKLILTLAMVLACAVGFAQNPAFKKFAENFGKETTFAYAYIGNRPVLLVTHEVFGDFAHDDLQAIAAAVFTLDADGKIVSLGSVRSQGTAYPVSVWQNKLIVAGHHFVSIYDIRVDDDPDLILFAHEEGDYDNPRLKDLFRTFAQATPLKFRHSLPQ
ncbi:MAG: hypothetical protein HUK14_02690 [Muribaculaceae bacterium]|nr:hypothetical protein [Muribaculaceae bacterium]